MQRYSVNKDIQIAAKKRLIELDLSQTELADKMGVTRGYVNRMLNSDEDWLPPAWSALFNELGLTLTVKEKSQG